MIEECLDYLGGSKVFSQLDLESGYHQIDVEKDSRMITTFTAPTGKYQFLKMPFGLRNAPAHFQNIMLMALSELIGKCCIVYLDDIIVYSKKDQDHCSDLKRVLDKLAGYGLRLNLKKCHFLTKKINFLGYTIDNGKIKPEDEKEKKFREMIHVKNEKELHTVIGCLTYYRWFINQFAEKTRYLFNVINKKESFDNERVTELLKKIVDELLDEGVLELPDVTKLS